MSKNSVIYTKNKQTGEIEGIKQYDITMVDWGFNFFVDDELSAFKAAYQFRDSPNGVIVEFAGGVQRWMVTVFNELGAKIGLDGSKLS